LNIVDSSAWLEVLVAGPNAQIFLKVIEAGELVVPAITIFEVCKRVRLTQPTADADRIESHMRRFTVIDLTADRASAAAALSLKHKLPMADGIIYAAALELGATVWTQDADFKGLAQVKFFKKTPA
jgi:toxin FitB